MAGFEISCVYCSPPNNMLMSFAPSKDQDPEEFNTAWKAAATNYSNIECAQCGSQYMLEDDPVGSVQRKNMSKPKLDSLTIGSGARTGGDALYIMGSALNVGTLVVKFGGKPALEITNRTATQARVVTPIGQYTLNIVSVTTPGFIVGEGVRGLSSGARASIASLSPFVVDFPLAAFTSGEEIQGDASGAKATLNAVPYSGAVDVSVENEHGQRITGGAVLNGFTYL